jgi:hypothetical protein
MDELLKTIILGAPNVAVAVAALYWASQRIDKMIDQQSKLIDALLVMCAENKALSAELGKLPNADENKDIG